MRQQPHFHSNIVIFSGCQGDTYCCHFPRAVFGYQMQRAATKHAAITAPSRYAGGGQHLWWPGASAPSSAHRGALGQLVPRGTGSLAWWVPSPPARGVGREGSPSKQGLGRGIGAQGCVFPTRTYPAMCHPLTDAALCSPLRTLCSPQQAHAGPLKIPHTVRQMVFPQISQKHRNFPYSELPPPCSKVYNLLGM